MFQSAEYIYEVYKTGSFSKAAKNLYITQPALSIAVKKEELELGQPIFERSTSHVRLTDAGRAYIDSVEKIKKIEESLRLYCNDISDLKTGTLKIGASNFLLSQVILPFIANFSTKYPGITIDLQEAPSLELKNRILNETLDIIVDPMDFEDKLFTSYHLFNDYFLLMVPGSFPINDSLSSYSLTREQICQNLHLDDSTPGVPLSQFLDEPFLLLRPETVTYERAMKICSQYGFSPKIRLFLDQLITSYRFAAEGMGIAFITDAVVKENPDGGTSLFYKIDSPLAKREIAAVHKKNRYMSKAALEFIELAKKQLEK